MAFSSIAALVAGGAGAASAVTVLGAVAEVGTAMTVVGAVTGSKTLTKVGGAMALVGGVGGLVAGATGAAGAAAGAAADALPAPVTQEAADAGFDGTELGAASDAGNGMAADASAAATAPDASSLDQSLGAGSSGTATMSMSPGQSAGSQSADFGLTSDSEPITNPGGIRSAMTNPSQSITSQPIASQPVASVTAPSDGTTPYSQPSQAVNTPAGTVGAAPAAAPAAPTTPPNPFAPQGVPPNPLAAGSGQISPLDSASYFQKVMTFAQDPKNKPLVEFAGKGILGAMSGVQKQVQFDKTLDLNNRRLAQTSHGSEVSRTGIISGARR